MTKCVDCRKFLPVPAWRRCEPCQAIRTRALWKERYFRLKKLSTIDNNKGVAKLTT